MAASSLHLRARRLVDGLDADDIAIIDVAADCLDLCRIDLKKPLLPLSRVSLGSDGLATSSISILCQCPHCSFHCTAVLQGYDASHVLPRQFQSSGLS